ncbi:MAG TPA: TetR/AcrR family transcriptional regulator [Sphingomicrobium sp.]|nr:TetR/AcrR family transcriptional regulator [Sphingomicrobium sp.]
MGRRSDHSRVELEAMIVAQGHRLLAETGFAGFSAREVARRVGYSVGTVYNLFDSLDHLLTAINGRTFELWTDYLRARVERSRGDRIHALVQAYFDFAREHPKLWMAIYDHRLPEGMTMADEDMQKRRALTQIVFDEIARELPARSETDVEHLARSLIATVHGHCTYELNGSFALMGEKDPVGLALGRVREAIAAAR